MSDPFDLHPRALDRGGIRDDTTPSEPGQQLQGQAWAASYSPVPMRTAASFVDVEILRRACTILGWLVRSTDGSDRLAAVRAARMFEVEVRSLIETNSNSGPTAPIQGQ